MDVSKAQVSNMGGLVQLVDPAFPWTVDVYLNPVGDRPEVRGLVVWARPDEEKICEPITSAVLAQLPMRQLASVAASVILGEDETLFRMLAKPRPAGQRSWPAAHFERVDRVASWARRTGRPGGAAGAVSEFWGVHYRTARRWIAHQQ